MFSEYSNYASKRIVTGLVSALGVGLVFGASIAFQLSYNRTNNIREVQTGYIAPADVKIRTEDLDHNQELETIVKVKDIDYLFKYDPNGNPVLQRYELRPQEVVPLENNAEGGLKNDF